MNLTQLLWTCLLGGGMFLTFATFGCSPQDDGAIHVSPRGNDAAAGTASAPLRTIQAAVDRAKPGQAVTVHAGTYRETVRPSGSYQDDAPLVVGAAEGSEPVLLGTDPVDGWQEWKDGIWRARLEDSADQLFLDGRAQTLARTPNAGENPYQPATFEMQADKTTITSEQFEIAEGSWDGAKLWALSSRKWVAGTSTIVKSQAGKIQLDSPVPFWPKGIGWGYVEGLASLIDQPGEWAWQDGWLYYKPADGADANELALEVPRRRWGFDLAGLSHVELRGLRFIATSVNTDGAEDVWIDRCRFRWASWRRDIRGGFNRDKGITIDSGGLGVVLGGTNIRLTDSVVAWAWGDGVSVYGRDNRVTNCVIHDCNLSASDCAPIDMTGRGHHAIGNTVFNAGRSGILHRKLAAGRIERNHIHHVGLMTTDLGGTYTFTTQGEGTVIAYNRIHDVHCKTGVGIYIDNICADFVIHHNLCYDNENSGIRINTPAENIDVYHNTLARNGNAMNWWGRDNNSSMPGTEVMNNILLGQVRLGEEAQLRDNFTEGDPMFVDPQAGDFRLRAGSPCVDAARVIEGITGPVVGQAPDIGAFEHGLEPWQAGSTLDRSLWDETGW